MVTNDSSIFLKDFFSFDIVKKKLWKVFTKIELKDEWALQQQTCAD